MRLGGVRWKGQMAPFKHSAPLQVLEVMSVLDVEAMAVHASWNGIPILMIISFMRPFDKHSINRRIRLFLTWDL